MGTNNLMNQLPRNIKELVENEEYQELQDEWSGLTPSPKKMGEVHLVLDKGVKTKVIGTVYGLEFQIEQQGFASTIYFDYYNRRLKVLDYKAEDYPKFLKHLAWIADANSFDKIFVKASKIDFQQFLSHGYLMEGVLKYYFNGNDAFVLSRFSTEKRIQSSKLFEESKLIEEIIYNSRQDKKRALDENIEIITGRAEHIPHLIYIYRSVFETYPSPLTNPDYIESIMGPEMLFKIAYRDGHPVAAASADISRKYSNAEMTDCATIPNAQGKGIMQALLLCLEADILKEGIQTAYTLARATSVGMNRSFFRLNYEFSGRLINNCDIFGQFEDLNIWVKPLCSE